MKSVAQLIAEAPIEVREPKTPVSTSDEAWKEIRALPPALPEAPVMPDSLIPPVLAPWLCDICERTQIPLDYVAAPAIVALSSVIGRTVGIYPKQRDDWLCVPNLWGVVIGRPGVLKSPALAEALKPLRRLALQAQEEHIDKARSAEAEKIVAQAQIEGLTIATVDPVFSLYDVPTI